MQDPLKYGTRTHHSNMDLYDRVHQGDVMEGAAIEVWFVYNTAMKPEMLPRKVKLIELPMRPGDIAWALMPCVHTR
jgi:hypothetical protein